MKIRLLFKKFTRGAFSLENKKDVEQKHELKIKIWRRWLKIIPNFQLENVSIWAIQNHLGIVSKK